MTQETLCRVTGIKMLKKQVRVGVETLIASKVMSGVRSCVAPACVVIVGACQDP